MADVDPISEIERLGQLRDKGLLDEEEFKRQKAELLSIVSAGAKKAAGDAGQTISAGRLIGVGVLWVTVFIFGFVVLQVVVFDLAHPGDGGAASTEFGHHYGGLVFLGPVRE
jgi:hypothetical protein